MARSAQDRPPGRVCPHPTHTPQRLGGKISSRARLARLRVARSSRLAALIDRLAPRGPRLRNLQRITPESLAHKGSERWWGWGDCEEREEGTPVAHQDCGAPPPPRPRGPPATPNPSPLATQRLAHQDSRTCGASRQIKASSAAISPSSPVARQGRSNTIFCSLPVLCVQSN
jgi:hypothetical protein